MVGRAAAVCVACGRLDRWRVRRSEQPGPGMLPGPVLGQVDGDAAGVAGDASGEVDQVSADGGRPGGGVAASGQGGGGAGEVMRDGYAGQPGVVGVKPARGQESPYSKASSALAAAGLSSPLPM